ncbi:MAG: AMP-binding protein [Phycisphaerales bacterium]|nr:AMP-binding protein [Phycisphaerales bacterium]
MLKQGHIGVHPCGALGVAFFVHARGDCFVGRGGGITDVIKRAGQVRLDDKGTLRLLPLRGRIFSNLLEAEALDHAPELLMVCCEPDQLAPFTMQIVGYLENLCGRGRLRDVEDVRTRVPILLILPNGILMEQTIAAFEEQIRESRVLGRLPTVTDAMIAALLDRIVRGISLQAGGRRGAGADAVYVLEKKGSLVFAGGGELERGRIEAILTAHDYPFKHARHVPGTRIEFDKGMISIVLNVGGLIHMVAPDGDLLDLRMGDLCKDETKADFVARVTRAVFDVGRACGAYPPDADFDAIWAGHRAIILSFANHVTSSVKSFRDAVGRGLASVKLFSNEEWILTPLGRYAARAGLTQHETLFKHLRAEVQEAMARAIRRKRTAGADGRNSAMRLAAQRDFSIELYDAGPDSLVVVGTMLDDEHLIKLELCIDLPNEQITRSTLQMIRAPFPVCCEIEAAAERLVGLRIERGVLSEINRRVGGRAGCSHIKELATNIVYFSASHIVRRRSGLEPTGPSVQRKPPEERFTLTKELLRDSCLAYCQTTPLGLDERVGIRRMGEEHASPIPLGDVEPSLGAVLRDRVKRRGDRTYLRYRTPGAPAREGAVAPPGGSKTASLTWNEFGTAVRRIARHLLDLGIRRGDLACMLSENRAEMFLFEMAVMSIGAVTVPVFAGYAAPQVDYVLGHSRPRLLVVSGKHQLEKVDRGRYPWIERVFCMDFDDAARSWGAEDFATLLREGGASEERLDERIDAVRDDDLCVVMYTSGTTGPPKGVQLTHGNLISQQKALSLIWDLSEHDVLMNYLPWHHSFGGLFERFLTLYHGAELCLDDSRGRDVERLLDNWRTFSPTIFCSVPRVHDLLMSRCAEDAGVEAAVFHARLRFVFTAGAPLSATVESAYRRHNVPVLEGWGLTETSPSVTLRTLGTPWRSGFVGTPIPGVTLRIDPDQEILVKGPNVMRGYLNDEEANSRVLTEDGWFRSGDLGEFTRDGLRIFGRKDGAFKLTTGEKVHPQRVENVLVNESPYITEAVAVGSGKDFVGALLFPCMAAVRDALARRGEAVDAADERLLELPAVRELFAQELRRINPLIEVKYQRVRRAVLSDQEPSAARGEITSSGKLIRKAVMDNHKRRIEALFTPCPLPNVVEVPESESGAAARSGSGEPRASTRAEVCESECASAGAAAR